MNTFFCTTLEPWPESGVSWRGALHLTAFSLRSDALTEESIAECQRGLKELAAQCESLYMNTFFSTTIGRWWIESIHFLRTKCSRVACSVLPPSEPGRSRGDGTVAKVCFSQ
jgi:hypothetical protein